MQHTPIIPVGVRLPLAHDHLTPADFLEMCRAGLAMGYSSFWVSDHILLPDASNSTYPHTEDGKVPFDANSPWLDPLLVLTWLSAQLPEARFGTSVVIMTLRNPTLLAKQLASMSWLTRAPISFGVGTGWLRDEYDVTGMRFEKRATRAKADIAEIKELITQGGRAYTVRGDDDQPVEKHFVMKPVAPAPVEFLWGGYSPVALRLVASSCDGWLPAKLSLEQLRTHLNALKQACADIERDFSELRLVAKPGSGPDPKAGRVDKDNLAQYAELGMHEVILELPLKPDNAAEAIQVMERVAARTWL